MTTTLYFLRHGETVENATGYFQGQTQGTLSSLGLAQARAVAPRVAALPIDAVLCSDLRRCRHTLALAMPGRPGVTLPVVYTPLLRERDMGSLTGRPLAGAVLDATVENEARATVRAAQLVRLVRRRYAGQTLLVVSHGYFLRVLEAYIRHIGFHDTLRVANCELRRVTLP